LEEETTVAVRPEGAAGIRRLIEANTTQGIDDAIVALMTRPDSTPGLARIDVPTLLVAGEEDALTPVALHERMCEQIAGARLVVIPGAGHLSSVEAPLAFSDALGRFLEGLEPAAVLGGEA
jgi:pimeloyl-ACP methyl ester carboxylesterase